MSEDLTRKLPTTDSEKIDLILTTVLSLERRLEKLEIRVDNVDSRLERLEQEVEQRFYDTRPIWHRVVADIAQLQAGQDILRGEILELHSTVREINRDQIVINDATRKIQLDFHNIVDRLHRLEVNRDRTNSST